MFKVKLGLRKFKYNFRVKCIERKNFFEVYPVFLINRKQNVHIFVSRYTSFCHIFIFMGNGIAP